MTRNPGLRPPARPLLVYDGNCAFCRLWIDRWRAATGDAVDYATSAEAAGALPGIPKEEFARSVVLILPDGSRRTGAFAAISALEVTRLGRTLSSLDRRIPFFRSSAESAYRAVAAHRDEAMFLTRLLWGRSVVPRGFAATRWIFLRGMAVVYAAAFLSLHAQVLGLVGSQGISPAEMLLEAVHAQLGAAGLLYYPTLAWIDPGDGFLSGLCVGGVVASAFLLAGVLPRPAAIACWVLYFSLYTAGQVFLQFQWDILLLEAGLLTIFFAPGGLAGLSSGGGAPPRAVRWLIWLLVFRLMVMSGALKLAAGDPNWWNLTALSYHFETQCLPNPVAWHVHHLPGWLHGLSTFGMFMIELGAPWLIFTPRRLRHAGAFLLLGLQGLIMLTGNYAFFNWLTVVLCVALFDDGLTARLVPRFLRGARAAGSPGAARRRRAGLARIGRGAVAAAASIMVLLNVLQLSSVIVPKTLWPRAVATVTGWASHVHLVSGYGLFRVMTTKRPEIVIEGSDDRTAWKAYEFPYKPGETTRPLPWVAPHQPRLDWQMWFAALGDYRSNGWIVNLAVRILEGSPDVLDLLAVNPFPDRPPRYVRALLYEYRFSSPEERARSGAVWTRSLNSLYLPPISLDGS